MLKHAVYLLAGWAVIPVLWVLFPVAILVAYLTLRVNPTRIKAHGNADH